MSTAAIMLAGISVVAVGDMLIALYFRSLADRVETGQKSAANIDPDRARKMSTALVIMAPLMWLIIALIAFGVIPASGIDPIKF